MLYFENKLRKLGYNFVIGVDEVGRGPLAGPVVAAAVLLKERRFINRIDDSKKLTSRQREKAYPEIIEKSVFGIGIINEKIIDRLNIAVATRIAMEEAVAGLTDKMGRFSNNKLHILVDGLVDLKKGYRYTKIIKGDSRSMSIAAASILAKVTRDRIMNIYHKVFPVYGFRANKGYPTRMHRKALRQYGPSLIHRQSFCADLDVL